MMGLVELRGKAMMDYEFVYEDDFLVIKLSGSTEVNERLSVKQYLAPYLQGSYQKVIVDLEGLSEPGGVYIVGVLNTIKKEFQLLDGRVKLCSLEPALYRYFQENRLDQIFDIGKSVESTKQSFKERNNDSESRRD
jgi:anti-anti-sigma factor